MVRAHRATLGRSRRSRICVFSILAATPQLLASSTSAAKEFAYVTHTATRSVSVIDVSTNELVATIPLGTGGGPVDLVALPNGRTLYVAMDGQVVVLDAQSNQVAARISGAGRGRIAAAPDGASVYAANNQSVSVIDTQVNAIVATVGELMLMPSGLAVSRPPSCKPWAEKPAKQLASTGEPCGHGDQPRLHRV
jgi:YVTN family beta-propeller protein